MARAAIRRRLSPPSWHVGDVVELRDETARVRTIGIELHDWPGHLPGQHVHVRLTAPDGYQAQRSYSISSAPESQRLELTVERIEDGEVSPYLVDDLLEGDSIEVRGPIGGHFAWSSEDDDRPLLLIGGGSGVVPLMAMVRHRVATGSRAPVRFLASWRGLDDVIYRDELERLRTTVSGIEIAHTLTRRRPADWPGFGRRIDPAMLAEFGVAPAANANVFICGPNGLVESVAGSLVELGHDPSAIRTERFGPSAS